MTLTRPKKEHRWAWALIGWTLLVWVSRLRLLFGGTDESTSDRVTGAVVATWFVIGALVLAHALVRSPRRLHTMIVPFAGFTIAYWFVRSVQILSRDHGVGFRVVHSVLALGSIALAGMAWRRHKAGTI